MSFLYYNLQLVTIIKSNIMVAKIFIYLQKFSMRVDEKKIRLILEMNEILNKYS